MWSPVLPPGDNARLPSSRCKHAMCLHRGSVFLYGGRDGNRALKDLWQYNIVTGKWYELRAKGEKPACLEEHSLVAYKGALYAFGGEFSFASQDDIPLWKLNLGTQIWEKPKLDPKSVAPSGRRGHTAVVCNEAMHIYGGYIDLKGSNSEFWTYKFGTNKWHLNYNLQMSADGPGARHCHSAVIYDNAMWVYGGMNDLNPRGDFWKWSFQFERWSRIRSKPSPPDLLGHSACKVSDGILLFGGEVNGDLSNELWKYQFRTQTWSRLQVQGTNSPGRTRHVSLLITSLHLSMLDDMPEEDPSTNNKEATNLPLPKTDATERSHSAPYLKKASQGVDLDDRPYSSPPVITPDSPTLRRFKNKILPNASGTENTDSDSRVKGWEINREQFIAKVQAKDICKDPKVEMTELVPLIRPKMTHSSTFDSCDSIRGFENMGYRKSSDGSSISSAWDDPQFSIKKSYSRCNSMDALREMTLETNFSGPVTSDKSDKRLSLPLDGIGKDVDIICDSSESNIPQDVFQNNGHYVAFEKSENVFTHRNLGAMIPKSKDYRLTNVYHGNLIDLNTVINNPDPQKTFVELFVASQNDDRNQINRGLKSSLDDNQTPSDSSSANTPTTEFSGSCDTCTMKQANWHLASPNSAFKSNLPGFVKSGSLDSMKQLKLFRMHATHFGSSEDESLGHDDVFLEDVESVDTESETENSSEDIRLIRKSGNKEKAPGSSIVQNQPQYGNKSSLVVESEKAPLIQGSRSRKESGAALKELPERSKAKLRDQMHRQMTAPPLGYKEYNDLYSNSVSVMYTFGGRELEAQNLSIKPISMWKYTFKEDYALTKRGRKPEWPW